MAERRYIGCLNEDEAREDAADREAIVAAPREQLRGGDKSLVGDTGYRRYLSGGDSPGFRIDEAKLAEDARDDGEWVLRADTELDAAEVASRYKQLWVVEHGFRSRESLSRTRPIYHKRDETIRGHVFRSFLALVLRQESRARLEERGHDPEWADVIQDLRPHRLKWLRNREALIIHAQRVVGRIGRKGVVYVLLQELVDS